MSEKKNEIKESEVNETEVNETQPSEKSEKIEIPFLSNKEKAAVLMGFLPIETAQEITSYLTAKEQEELAKAIAVVPRYEVEEVEETVVDYLSFLGSGGGYYEGGLDRAMKLLEGTMTESQIAEVLSRIYSDSAKPAFEGLKNIRDVGILLPLLQGEDPQFIAVLATYLKPELAANLLMALSEEKMVEVAIGVAKMGKINPNVLMEMDNYLTEKVKKFLNEDNGSTDGIKNIVEIINLSSRSAEKRIFETMDTNEPELAQQIRENLFVFDDLVTLDNRSLQTVVMNITDNGLIAKALKIADVEISEKFKSVMPEGRRKLLLDEEEGMGPIKRSEAEEAQSTIANIVKELEQSKQIVIQRGEGDVIL